MTGFGGEEKFQRAREARAWNLLFAGLLLLFLPLLGATTQFVVKLPVARVIGLISIAPLGDILIWQAGRRLAGASSRYRRVARSVAVTAGFFGTAYVLFVGILLHAFGSDWLAGVVLCFALGFVFRPIALAHLCARLTPDLENIEEARTASWARLLKSYFAFCAVAMATTTIWLVVPLFSHRPNLAGGLAFLIALLWFAGGVVALTVLVRKLTTILPIRPRVRVARRRTPRK